jgi:hypothetical protein
MLYCKARCAARRDAADAFVPLNRQDARLWDWNMIVEVEGLLTQDVQAGRFPFALRHVGGGCDDTSTRSAKCGAHSNSSSKALHVDRRSPLRPKAARRWGDVEPAPDIALCAAAQCRSPAAMLLRPVVAPACSPSKTAALPGTTYLGRSSLSVTTWRPGPTFRPPGSTAQLRLLPRPFDRGGTLFLSRAMRQDNWRHLP